MTDSICRRSPLFGIALLPAPSALMVDNPHSHAALAHAALDYDPAEGSAAVAAAAAVSSIT